LRQVCNSSASTQSRRSCIALHPACNKPKRSACRRNRGGGATSSAILEVQYIAWSNSLRIPMQGRVACEEKREGTRWRGRGFRLRLFFSRTGCSKRSHLAVAIGLADGFFINEYDRVHLADLVSDSKARWGCFSLFPLSSCGNDSDGIFLSPYVRSSSSNILEKSGRCVCITRQ